VKGAVDTSTISYIAFRSSAGKEVKPAPLAMLDSLAVVFLRKPNPRSRRWRSILSMHSHYRVGEWPFVALCLIE